MTFSVTVFVAGCQHDPTPPEPGEVCTGYGDWSTSAYVLPYPAGSTYRVIQGNCAPLGNGHRGVNRYSYDFDLPIGATVVAARAGVVADIEQSHLDGEVAATGLDNYLTVRHSDGTVALYGHLTHDGARVPVGAQVTAGQVIAASGNTGNTNNVPHLHLSVHACNPVTGGSAACASLPLTFRNTDPNPNGLEDGRSYLAR